MNKTMAQIEEVIKVLSSVYKEEVIVFVKTNTTSSINILSSTGTYKVSSDYDNKQINFVVLTNMLKKHNIKFVNNAVIFSNSKISVEKTNENGVYNLLDTNQKFITTISEEYIKEICFCLQKCGEKDESLCKFLIESQTCAFAFANVTDCFNFIFLDDNCCEECKFFANHISDEEKENMLMSNDCVNKVGKFFYVMDI